MEATLGQSEAKRFGTRFRRELSLAPWIVGCWLVGLALNGYAGQLVSTENPTVFFTNVAARLLQTGFTFGPDHIQVYPTNQYTPSVHRLLQVAANLYDAAATRTYGIPDATNGFPTVFRPLFRQTPDGQVLIAGYREVTNSAMAYAQTAPTNVDFSLGLNTNGTIKEYGTPFDPDDRNEAMVAGMPLVIGARKGFPNFNEFVMQTAVAVTRRLEFTNKSPNVTILNLATNQMYVVSISNSFGVEAWNPYTNAYSRSLQMMVAVSAYTCLSNESGVVLTNDPSFSSPGPLSVLQTTGAVYSLAGWPGYDTFRQPLYYK